MMWFIFGCVAFAVFGGAWAVVIYGGWNKRHIEHNRPGWRNHW